MLSYAKLWILLESKGMKKTDLKEIISGNTLAKLGKNETISSAVIEKICAFLDCQPGDIMEYISEKKVQEVVKQFGNLQQIMVNGLKENGISEEQIKSLMTEAIPQYMESIFNGGNPLEDMMNEAMKKQSDKE